MQYPDTVRRTAASARARTLQVLAKHCDAHEAAQLITLIDSEIWRRMERMPAIAPDGTRAARQAAMLMGAVRGHVHAHPAIVDIGCNDGQVSVALARVLRAREIAGVDVVAPAQVARRVRYWQGVDRVPASEWGRWDLVVASMTLHHIPNARDALVLAGHLLRPGGTLLLREHSVREGALRAVDRALVDIEHRAYDARERREVVGAYAMAHYWSERELAALVRSSHAAWRLVSQSEPRGATRWYTQVWQKGAV